MYNRGMNFKRNFLSIITFVGSIFLIAGCNSSKNYTEFEFLDPEKDLNQAVDTHEDQDYGSYIKYGNYSSYPAKGSGDTIYELGSAHDVLYNYAGQHILNSSGLHKLLVVPVEFSDFTTGDLGVEKSEYVTNLKKAFFGVSKNNKYVSVAEYYNRSSYGKLQISGTVCDKFYTFPTTTKDIIDNELTSNVVHECYNKVINWFKKTYPNASLDEYRIDPKDSSSDLAIYLVYTYPTELKTNTKVFWDYTFLDRAFSWTSYSSLNTIAGQPDAHTLIHETGHLFGLTDYYPSNENDADPTGRIDMMDCSVGDHSGFSKMMLDWARPYHVKDTCEIKLNALVNYGDLILINDSWNKTAFDEYYLLEFYSPTGLNNYDSNVGNNKAKLPFMPGVKIYHVDARLGYYEYDSSVKEGKIFKYYCDESGTMIPSSLNKNINLAHDNTTHSSATSEQTNLINNLYELKLNNSSSILDGCANDVNLFHTGDSYVINSTSFNKKPNSSNYKISILDTNFRDCTIKVERL